MCCCSRIEEEMSLEIVLFKMKDPSLTQFFHTEINVPNDGISFVQEMKKQVEWVCDAANPPISHSCSKLFTSSSTTYLTLKRVAYIGVWQEVGRQCGSQLPKRAP